MLYIFEHKYVLNIYIYAVDAVFPTIEAKAVAINVYIDLINVGDILIPKSCILRRLHFIFFLFKGIINSK